MKNKLSKCVGIRFSLSAFTSDNNLVEDENHFIFQCHFYHTLRNQFFQNVKDLYPELDVINNLKIKYFMSETLVKDTSGYIYGCYINKKILFISNISILRLEECISNCSF